MAWISGNRYLTMDEMQNNVDIIHYYFITKGWTENAIAGMLGNMQSESSINPGIWEGLDAVAKGGYGLVQWTPYTKYADWAGAGWEDNGQKEMERIIYELEKGLQWGATSKYPMSFRDFTLSDRAPSYLAQAWLYNYERPSSLNQPWRSTQADYWYQYISGREPPKSIPIWLLIKMSKGGRS